MVLDVVGGKLEWDYLEAIRFVLLSGSNDVLEEMIVMGCMDVRCWVKSVGFDVKLVMRGVVGEFKIIM